MATIITLSWAQSIAPIIQSSLTKTGFLNRKQGHVYLLLLYTFFVVIDADLLQE